MKIQTALIIAAMLTASLQQPSSADNPNHASAHGLQTKATAIGAKASATGTVKIVGTKAGKITISHGPVKALKWPAMTMAFKATPKQLVSVHVGQQVEFEFVSKDMDATLTRIASMQ